MCRQSLLNFHHQRTGKILVVVKLLSFIERVVVSIFDSFLFPVLLSPYSALLWSAQVAPRFRFGASLSSFCFGCRCIRITFSHWRWPTRTEGKGMRRPHWGAHSWAPIDQPIWVGLLLHLPRFQKEDGYITSTCEYCLVPPPLLWKVSSLFLIFFLWINSFTSLLSKWQRSFASGLIEYVV